MANDKASAERLAALIKENEERQAARAGRIAKLSAERATAETKYNDAVGRYNKAKGELNAAEMIKVKAEVDAAGEVLAMFTEALIKEERANAFTYDEVMAKYDELATINNTMTAEANKAICALLVQIESIVNDAEKAAADLDAVFDRINNNTASCGQLTAGQLVQNMRRAVNNARKNFAAYWPNK